MATTGSPPREAFSVAEAARMLGVGTQTLWKQIWAGEVRVSRLGRRVLIAQKEIDRLLEGAPWESS